MSRNIIDLDEKYAISADDLNTVLHERKVNTDEKSKNFGNVYYSNLGYYHNVESLLKGMINKKINVELQNIEELNDLNKNIDMEKYISEYKHLIGCEYRVENCNREYFITEQHTNIHWKHDKPALWDTRIKFFTEDDELVTYEEYMELYYPEYRHVWEKQL